MDIEAIRACQKKIDSEWNEPWEHENSLSNAFDDAHHHRRELLKRVDGLEKENKQLKADPMFYPMRDCRATDFNCPSYERLTKRIAKLEIKKGQ
jgi:hypothetical protein